jgi:hypothetical protein
MVGRNALIAARYRQRAGVENRRDPGTQRLNQIVLLRDRRKG